MFCGNWMVYKGPTCLNLWHKILRWVPKCSWSNSKRYPATCSTPLVHFVECTDISYIVDSLFDYAGLINMYIFKILFTRLHSYYSVTRHSYVPVRWFGRSNIWDFFCQCRFILTKSLYI